MHGRWFTFFGIQLNWKCSCSRLYVSFLSCHGYQSSRPCPVRTQVINLRLSYRPASRYFAFQTLFLVRQLTFASHVLAQRGTNINPCVVFDPHLHAALVWHDFSRSFLHWIRVKEDCLDSRDKCSHLSSCLVWSAKARPANTYVLPGFAWCCFPIYTTQLSTVTLSEMNISCQRLGATYLPTNQQLASQAERNARIPCHTHLSPFKSRFQLYPCLYIVPPSHNLWTTLSIIISAVWLFHLEVQNEPQMPSFGFGKGVGPVPSMIVFDNEPQTYDRPDKPYPLCGIKSAWIVSSCFVIVWHLPYKQFERHLRLR